MAERRMFAKTIVTSDAFLDMPLSARCLYFTLGMFADDDGFVNNPKSIMRQVGACTDDLNILLAKRFILTFASGVIVIKHWKIHNYIAKDRYKETKYIEEKSTLSIDEKGAYTECIQDVYKVDTQVRLGKDSIGEFRVVEGSANVYHSDSDPNTENDEFSTKLSTDSQFEALGGTLGQGVVMLTPEQDEALLDKLGFDGYNHYISKLANFIIEKDAKVGNHYATILKWAKEDARV
jgi:hypothetical protein